MGALFTTLKEHRSSYSFFWLLKPLILRISDLIQGGHHLQSEFLAGASKIHKPTNGSSEGAIKTKFLLHFTARRKLDLCVGAVVGCLHDILYREPPGSCRSFSSYIVHYICTICGIYCRSYCSGRTHGGLTVYGF